MTDDELANELSGALHAVADAYEPTTPVPDETPARVRVQPIVLAAAAAMIVVAGLGIALLRSDDDAADLDVRDTATSSTTSIAVDEDADTQPLAAWLWTVGSPAPIEPRGGHEVAWSGDEFAVLGGDLGPGAAGEAAAYDPDADSWRILIQLEVEAARSLRDNPAVAVTAGIEPVAPAHALGNILYGTVDATPLEDGGPGPWTLTGDDGGQVELPNIPDRYGFGFRGARAAWTGDALVVWGGIYDCGPGANCASFGPNEPFILRPPADEPTVEPGPEVDLPMATGEPVDLTELLGITWVLYSIELDGELVADDEPGTIAFEINQAGPEPWPLPLTATGWAGCDIDAAMVSQADGQLGWSAAPSACAGEASSLATLFVDRLADTEQLNLLELWPTPFLELTAPDIRILLVPATSNTVVGPVSANPPATLPPSYPETGPPSPGPTPVPTGPQELVLARMVVDGTTVTNDEPRVITMTVNGSSILSDWSTSVEGWAGCDYRGDVTISSAIDLTWDARPDLCSGEVSAYAATFLDRLRRATSASVNLSPPLGLTVLGPGFELHFVVGVVQSPPTTTTTAPPPDDVLPEATGPGAWPLLAAPFGPLDHEHTFDFGEETITLGHYTGVPSTAIVGYGYNATLDRWRVIQPRTAFPGNVIEWAMRTGDRVSTFLDDGGLAGLWTYRPSTDSWDVALGYDGSYDMWDFRYENGRVIPFSGTPEFASILYRDPNYPAGLVGSRTRRLEEPWPDPGVGHAPSLDELFILSLYVDAAARNHVDTATFTVRLDDITRSIVVEFDSAVHDPSDAAVDAARTAVEATVNSEMSGRNFLGSVGDHYEFTFVP